MLAMRTGRVLYIKGRAEMMVQVRSPTVTLPSPRLPKEIQVGRGRARSDTAERQVQDE
jgi:hypothetical protein